ncbi:unnamed protein product [Spirodela intermedia]|uniref:S-acyltransferase n=1 Tax=Spirodela intermedia TaxID=51605 RepID=A0A7I8I7J8_SPIIN|nr:unnamed protein product [Spirodela intermedia]CAA6653540.1 unnamed protein product [Spirodela intermedia]
MRKHGWQLPYHPLQVVAIAVFMALGFAFYVFFIPFVGKKQFEVVVMGLYTPLVACVFFLYIWCAAADPGDPGRYSSSKGSLEGGESISSSVKKADAATDGGKPSNEPPAASEISDKKSSNKHAEEKRSRGIFLFLAVFLGCFPSLGCTNSRSHEHSSDHETSEDGMFYCSLCEVEVLKYSKHCRVCDKCVDGFDHHCRWINNCIGRKNYFMFFILMMSALLLLILQCSIGILVLIRCFLERKQFSVDIASKLGSSFSLVPFLVVVGSCTFLAMVAALPIAQLFFFHVLLIKKGISTYDYIVALREQEQHPQMSPLSSITGLSSASSFTTFRRGSWCTPPRLFLEDQFDVVPPYPGVAAISGQKRAAAAAEEQARKRNPPAIKISPWTLARLNAEEVSKAAAQARKKSKIMQPVVRRENPLLPPPPPPPPLETDSSSRQDSAARNYLRRWRQWWRWWQRSPPETSTSLAPLQLEARNAFRSSRAMFSPANASSSPESSSLDSPDLQPFCITSATADIAQGLAAIPPSGQTGILLSRSTSDGYDASGGEDSDRVPSRIVHRSSNWSKFFATGEPKAVAASSSSRALRGGS